MGKVTFEHKYNIGQEVYMRNSNNTVSKAKVVNVQFIIHNVAGAANVRYYVDNTYSTSSTVAEDMLYNTADEAFNGNT
jgi:hypothetical protein